MSQKVLSYINEVSEKYKTGRAGEHAYRPTFEKLVKTLDQKIGIINDPKRTEYGAPDFVFVRGELITGYVETKDIDADLDKVEKTEQVKRYLGYSNLILTNYLEFRFFRNGERYGEPIVVGKIINEEVHIQEKFADLLENAITDFLAAKPEKIKSGSRLAKIMGGKARRIRDNVKQFFTVGSDNNKELIKVYDTIKKLLVHDLNPDTFADMYAQTLVYGLFVARFGDSSPENFTRQEARDLVPASNPFLRHFFDHIAGADFDQRLAYIVNELCEVFKVADVQQLMSQYFQKDLWGKDIKGPDPVIHFYEDFLNEYDPILRKKMGAYYTPLPVVYFIVRAIDDILQKEFKLTNGLADTSKLPNGLHRVQVLDPAVGTGTFISAVIRIIYERFVKTKQEGRWPTYVHHDLLPRIYGFELMMASYTIAHLKLSMAFKETGFKHFNRRLGIYLTNSLEESTVQDGGLFPNFGLAESIAKESKEASVIKNKTPIMVVLGNPPYSSVSSNKTDYANSLVEKYKVEPGGIEKLKERKNWLDDDYVKFISLAENLVDKNGEGVLAYITNNGFIDNPTFRGMRWHLLKTFDDIYILDLHGNARKKETIPDGGKDENVFNIMQGVSINIFIKKNKDKKELGNIHYADLYGKRENKFDFLNKNNFGNIKWNKIKNTLPNLFFLSKGNIKDEEKYNQGFSLGDLFIKYSCGVVTMGDHFIVDIDKDVLVKRMSDFLNNEVSESNLKIRYELGKNYANWIVKNKTKIKIDDDKIIRYSYRPFDERYTIFDSNLIWRTRENVMKDVYKNNFSLVFEKIASNKSQPVGIFLSKNIIDCHLTGGQSYIGNLYSVGINNEKIPNMNSEIISRIKEITGDITPEDVFDYVYAVLHSPDYRKKYKEFLKIDFPRIPYPEDKKQFKSLIAFGKELRSIHLFESPKLNRLITTYSEDGSDIIEEVKYKDKKVFLNKNQYFGNVPEEAWNFWVGAYQPAQKWLKDRKGRTLTNEDIEHYQKMIVALAETDQIMKEIDGIGL